MKKYSINEMARLVSADRTNVARFIQRHELKEINVDRPYKNSPKYFDEAVFERIKAEYLPKEPRQDDDRRGTASDRLEIELLREQLAEARQDKQILLKLLEQQQQLALLSTQKLNTLELELKEVTEEQEESEIDHEQPTENQTSPSTKKRKWYHFFSRK